MNAGIARALWVCLTVAVLSAFGVRAEDEAKTAAPFPEDWFWTTDHLQTERDAMIGKPMPKWELAEWTNAEKKADDLKGKIVVVDFWATWCGPCIAAIPHTNEIMAEYKDKGVEVLAICCSDGAENMETVAKEKAIKYSTAKDVEKKSASAWNVGFWPTFAVVDREGIVRAIGIKPDYVDDIVEKILEEQPMPEEKKAE
ncbi:MAG: hypothetical protein AMXMBFR84_20320 [Candidatus Hydrogenedentota bacterium]